MTKSTEKTIMEMGNRSENHADEKFKILDLLLIIADNLRLLILGPITVTLIVFIISSIWTKTYESTAILKAEQITASIMNSPAVLDSVASSVGFTKEMSLDDARTKLKKHFKVHFNYKDKYINITTQAESALEAQALASVILQQTYLQSRPRESEKKRLQLQMEQAKNRENEAIEASVILRKGMSGSAKSGITDIAQGYAQLIRVVQDSQAAQIELDKQLVGLDESALVQAPTLPTKPAAPDRGLISVFCLLLSGCCFFLLVLVRVGFKNYNKNPVFVYKIKLLQVKWRNFLGY